MSERLRKNNFFQSASTFTNDTQEKSNNSNYNKSSKCKQKSMDINSDKINFNNLNHNNSNNNNQNIKNNYNNQLNEETLNDGNKAKRKTCKAKILSENNKEKIINNLKDKKNKNIYENNIIKSNSKKNVKNINNIFINYTNNRNSKKVKNKDNNTKIFNDSHTNGDEFENFQINNEDIDEKKDNISIKKIPTENIKNIKNLCKSHNYFINEEKGLYDKNIINYEKGLNNKIKRSCYNIDNNETYVEDDNINQDNYEKNKKNKNENQININDDNNNDNKKNRNLSCKVKKKRKICVSTLNTFQDFSKEKDGIILFENGIGVNDCFLNSIIQVLFHLEEFKNKLIQLKIKIKQNNPIFQLYSIFQNYNTLLKVNPFETLNASLLRESLHHTYGKYEKGKCGDPMETISQILELIHSQYFQNNTDKDNNNFCQNELCPSHSNFLLNLKEIKFCPNCKAIKMQIYDKDCFMYDVLSCEILSLVKDESFYDYKYMLFTKLKKLNQSFGDNQQKLEKCKCKEINTQKKLFLYNKCPPYLIINITWDTDFPKMSDICKIYGLIPIDDNNKHLFEIECQKGSADNLVKKYYLSSMILYGQNHYTCLFYNKIINKWSFVDDNKKKNFDNYNELINSLIIRRSIPVGIIFYYQNDFKDENADNLFLNEEEFNNLYEKSLANDKRDIEDKKKEETIIKNIQKNKHKQKNTFLNKKQFIPKDRVINNEDKNINNQNIENRNNYYKEIDNTNNEYYGKEEVIKIKKKTKKNNIHN